MEIKVPRLGWNMEQGVFLGWLRKDGDRVEAGQPLYTLEGDKAAQEIEATDGGILRILPDGPKENDTVLVGAVVGYLAAPGEAFTGAAGTVLPSPPEYRGRGVGGEGEGSGPEDPLTPNPSPPSTGARGTRKEAAPAGVQEKPQADIPAGPAVRRMARERGIDLALVQGSGPTGRITEDDVRAHSPARPAPASPERSTRRQPAITPRARRAAAKLGVDWATVCGSGRDGRIRERDIQAQPKRRPAESGQPGKAPSNIRRVIAERMLHSLRTTAPVTLTTTADATNLTSLRQQFRASAAAREAIVPTFTDFIVKLTAMALESHPALNARWEDDRIITSAEVHVGVAVDTEAGLLVPVIRNAERLTMRGLASHSKELLDRARARRLTAEEMQGGTFTVSNLGAFGIDAFTPIIDWPQCAILGVGRIHKRPAVVDNQVVPRDQVTLSLTFDHRLVDGAPAARFLQTLVQGIENPAAWLVG